MKKLYLLPVLLLFTQLLQAQVVLEANINPDTPPNDINSSGPGQFTEYQGNLIFRANEESVGIELWEYTVANGVNLIANVRPGDANASPSNFMILNDVLYFTAFDENVSGIDLFSYDGSSVSSESLYGNQFSGLFNPIKLNDKIYYTGFNSSFQPNKLIEFDGTTGGEVPDQGSGDENVLGGSTIPYNGEVLLYMNYSTDDASTGTELYKYDPSAQTFSLVKDVNPGSGNGSISDFVAFNSLIYFEGNDQLWFTDGTTPGTDTVAEFDAQNLSDPSNLYNWNGVLYFEAETQNDGDELFKYNPTTNAITQLSNTSGANEDHDPEDFVALNGFLYYAAEDGNDTETHLWRTDGSTVEQLDNFFVDVQNLAVYDDRVFFSAEEEDVTGDELYTFDPETFSINTADQLESVSFYPNPSNGLIQFSNADTLKNYRLFDISGKKVDEGEVINNEINLSDKASGNYLLVVDNGNAKKTFKLVLK